MKKLALFTSSFSRNGVARNRITLASAFLDLGYAVEFVVSHDVGEVRADVPAACRVVELGTSRPREMIPRLRAYLKSSRPDAMIAASWPNTGAAIVARLLARRDMPLVVSEHYDFRTAPDFSPRDRILLRFFARWLYGLASNVVTVAEGTGKGLAVFTGFPERKVRVIYNPLRPMVSDAPENALPEDLERWWLGGGRRLLAVGRLELAKDYHTMISALARLPPGSARLLILGEGGLRAELERHAQANGVGEFVRFAGFQSDVAAFYRLADLFLLTSTNEGFANVVLEALSFGVPVVSTDCMSGPAEILGHGRWGRLAPVGSVDAIAQQINAALAEEPDRAQLIARSREFLPDAIARQYLDLLFPDSSPGAACATAVSG